LDNHLRVVSVKAENHIALALVLAILGFGFWQIGSKGGRKDRGLGENHRRCTSLPTL
jgi:hypothetical protein